jgi:hypothetical protein
MDYLSSKSTNADKRDALDLHLPLLESLKVSGPAYWDRFILVVTPRWTANHERSTVSNMLNCDKLGLFLS